MISIRNIIGHLKTIHTHRKWVIKYCFLAGIPFRGLTHDLSKYSPTEFWESARYWTGTQSPINQAKEAQGYSRAWLHHKGRNKHHWAYWTDNFSDGTTVYLMPQKDFTELVCDFLAAGRAYHGKDFSYQKEYEWWQIDKEHGNRAMHEKNKAMLDEIFHTLALAEKRHTISPEELIWTELIQRVYRKYI